ncbi:hypothetical protein HDU92_007443, partial [Lobulomyces angularis]
LREKMVVCGKKDDVGKKRCGKKEGAGKNGAGKNIEQGVYTGTCLFAIAHTRLASFVRRKVKKLVKGKTK